jgi:hypothetical protein
MTIYFDFTENRQNGKYPKEMPIQGVEEFETVKDMLDMEHYKLVNPWDYDLGQFSTGTSFSKEEEKESAVIPEIKDNNSISPGIISRTVEILSKDSAQPEDAGNIFMDENLENKDPLVQNDTIPGMINQSSGISKLSMLLMAGFGGYLLWSIMKK